MNDLYIYTDAEGNTVIATQPPLPGVDEQEALPGIDVLISSAVAEAHRNPGGRG